MNTDWTIVTKKIETEAPKIRLSKSQAAFLQDGIITSGVARDNLDGSDWTPGAYAFLDELKDAKGPKTVSVTLFLLGWIDGLIDRCIYGSMSEPDVRSEYYRARRLKDKMEKALVEAGTTRSEIRRREQGFVTDQVVQDADACIAETNFDEAAQDARTNQSDVAEELRSGPFDGPSEFEIQEKAIETLGLETNDPVESAQYYFDHQRDCEHEPADDLIVEHEPDGTEHRFHRCRKCGLLIAAPKEESAPTIEQLQHSIEELKTKIDEQRGDLAVAWEVARRARPGARVVSEDPDNPEHAVRTEFATELLGLKNQKRRGEIDDDQMIRYLAGQVLNARFALAKTLELATFGSIPEDNPEPLKFACKFCGKIVPEDDGLWYEDGEWFFCSEAHGDTYTKRYRKSGWKNDRPDF